MELNGTRFGRIEYADEDLIDFPHGLIGMPDHRQWLVLDFEEDVPFKWLQSADEPNLGLLIGEPQLFRPDFALALSESDQRDLEVESVENLVVFVICTYREDSRLTTGNLLGPVIVNASRRMGQQVIVENSDFSTHELLNNSAARPKEVQKEQVAESCG